MEILLALAVIVRRPTYYGVLPVHGLIWSAVPAMGLVCYLYRASVTSSLLLDSLRQDLISHARANGALKAGVEQV